YTVTATDATGNQASGTVDVNAPPPPVVAITAPVSGSSVGSPLTVKATFSNGGVPQYMKLSASGVVVYTVNNSVQLAATISLAAEATSGGVTYSAVEYITVQ